MNRRKMGVDEEESEDEDEGSGAKTGSRAGAGAGGRGATEPQPQPDTSGARPGTSAGPETEGSPVGSSARTGRPAGEPSSPRRPGETDDEREKRKWQERFKEWKATKGAGPADVRGNVPGRPAPVPGSDPNEAPGDQYASRRPSSSTSVPMNTFCMRSYGPWSSTAADREESERKAKEETERRRRERAEQSARVMHDRDRKNAEHDQMLVTLHRIRWSEFELAASKAKQAGNAQGGEPGEQRSIHFDSTREVSPNPAPPNPTPHPTPCPTPCPTPYPTSQGRKSRSTISRGCRCSEAEVARRGLGTARQRSSM